MAITKVIQIDVEASQGQAQVESLDNSVQKTEESTKSLRTQLREAQLDVARMAEKFGDTSREAIEAAKKAAKLKDAIGDAKDMTNAFNPDAKFNALSGALQGVAGGFSAVQGAMGLFGSESQDVEKMLLKVNSAMAFSEGLNSVMGSIDSFKNLKNVVSSYSLVQKVSTAAQWLWNAAMSANPIGAVVIAVTALIAAGYKLISYFQNSAAAARQQEAAIKKSALALESQKKAAANSAEALKDNQSYQMAMAKATGKSSEEIRKIALQHANEAVALNYKNTMMARATFLRERDTLATMKAEGANEDLIKAQAAVTQKSWEEFNKQRDGLYSSYKQRKQVIQDGNVEIAQEETDARKKQAEAQQKANDEAEQKAKERSQKLAEERQKSKDELKAIEEQSAKEIEDLNADTEFKKLELAKKRELEKLNAIKVSTEEKKKAEKQIEEKYELLKKQNDEKAFQERQKIEEARIAAQKKFDADREKDALVRLEMQKVIIEDEKTQQLNALQEVINKYQQGTNERLKAEEEFATKKQEYDNQLLLKQEEIDVARYNKDLQRTSEIAKNEELSFQQRLQALIQQEAIITATKTLSEEERTKALKTNADERKKIETAELESKSLLLDKTSELLKKGSQAIGEQTAIGKGLAVSAATIDTYSAANKALKADYGIFGPFAQVARFASVAATIALGVRNIKSIAATKVPSSSGGGGGGSSAAAIAAPQPSFNLVGNAGVNQIAQNIAQQGSQPVKAYVVSKDVTTAQELDRNKVRATRI